MPGRGEDFAHIVYTLLVVEKVRSIHEVANEIGMSYAVLHSRMIGRSTFSADEIRNLLKALPDPRLVGYLLEGTSFVPAGRIDGNDEASATKPDMAIQRGATRVVVEAAGILDLVDASLAGGGLDHRHRGLLVREIVEAEQTLASLRLKVAHPN